MDTPGPLIESLDFEPRVTVEGPQTFTVSPDTLGDLEVRSRSVEIVCATGSSYTAAWTGPTVESLLDAASVSPETTHIVVESADGYRVVIPIREALGGVLSYLKDDEPIGANQEYVNRFVSPGTEGARDIKGVSRIEPVELEPGEEPESLEKLFPEGERFTANRYEKEAEENEADMDEADVDEVDMDEECVEVEAGGPDSPV